MPGDRKRKLASYEALGMAWSLGWRVAAGAYIGYRLDLWLGSQGVFTLVLSLVALVMGVRLMLEMQGRAQSQDSDSSSEDRSD